MVGSAWTPWVRPMMGVCLNSMARLLEDFGERDDAGADDGGGFLELEGLRGVDDVGGGEAVVEPAGLASGSGDVLGDGGGEGDDVVADFGFDRVDAVDGEAALVADGVGGGLRGRGRLRRGPGEAAVSTLEPAAVFVLVGPDAAHGGAGVAGDQRGSFVEQCTVDSGQ